MGAKGTPVFSPLAPSRPDFALPLTRKGLVVMLVGMGVPELLVVGIIVLLPLSSYFIVVRLLADYCKDLGSDCPKALLIFIGIFMTPVTLAVFALLLVLDERNELLRTS